MKVQIFKKILVLKKDQHLIFKDQTVINVIANEGFQVSTEI